jgi:SAM-dependent methyltransferase
MADDLELSEHAVRNRDMWNADAPNWVAAARRNWEARSPHWGMWEVPEEQVHILPDVRGQDVLDLGCGTGYWCAWLSRLGANPTGVDVSEAQLATAREMQREFGIDFPLVHASAENPPFEDGSFDLVFSEYGAAIWCDPYVWIRHAHRLLRPGGRLIFLGNSVLSMLCAVEDEDAISQTLLRPQFGLHRLDWPDSAGSNFCLPHGEMLRLLRETGFEVEALHELRAPEGATTRYEWVTHEWARQWPCEEIWVARRE